MAGLGILMPAVILQEQNSELQPDFILFFLDASLQCRAAFGAEMNWQSCFVGIRGESTHTHTRRIHTSSPVFCRLIVYSVGGWLGGGGRAPACVQLLGSCVWEWRLGSCLRASLGPCVGDADAVH